MQIQKHPGQRPGPHDSFLQVFQVFSTLEDGLAEGGRRLPEADIASPFRRRGCAKDPAARLCGRGGFGQGLVQLKLIIIRPFSLLGKMDNPP